MTRLIASFARFALVCAFVIACAARVHAGERLHPSREDEEFHANVMAIAGLVGLVGFGIALGVRVLRRRATKPEPREQELTAWDSGSIAPRASPFAAPEPAPAPAPTLAPPGAPRVFARGKTLVFDDHA